MLGAFLAKTHDTQGKLLKDNSTATQAHQQNHCITANPPKLGRVIQNSWYDEECHDTRRCLQREVTQSIYIHKQAKATFQRLVRKKKRLYLAKFDDHLYRLFLGQESKRTWKMFNDSPSSMVSSMMFKNPQGKEAEEQDDSSLLL